MVNDMSTLQIDYKLILASNSPRRRELLAGLGLPFEVRVLPNVEENYPHSLPADQVAGYIAGEKAEAYRSMLAADELVITADTVVIAGGDVLGKPHDADDARRMLKEISGHEHHVVTGVCLTTAKRQSAFSVSTAVRFKPLSDEEIDYYIALYHPFDKAGAYGIQEWIGMTGVTAISGSYFNVMGLPVQRIYEELRRTFGLKFVE